MKGKGMADKKPELTDDSMIPIMDMGFDLPLHKVQSLLSIFQEPGWRVLEEIWQEEENASIGVGMSLTSTEEDRARQRGVYHKLLDLKCLPGNIRHAHDVALRLIEDEESPDTLPPDGFYHTKE